MLCIVLAQATRIDAQPGVLCIPCAVCCIGLAYADTVKNHKITDQYLFQAFYAKLWKDSLDRFRMLNLLLQHELISKHQHSFFSKCPTTTNLLYSING